MLELHPEQPPPSSMENKSDNKERDEGRQSDKLSFTFPGLQKLCQSFSLKVTFERENLIHGRMLNVPGSCSVYFGIFFILQLEISPLLLQYGVLTIIP